MDTVCTSVAAAFSVMVSIPYQYQKMHGYSDSTSATLVIEQKFCWSPCIDVCFVLKLALRIYLHAPAVMHITKYA